MAQYQLGALRSNRKTFFGLHLYLAERCCKNPQTARGPAYCKSGPAIARLVGVTGNAFVSGAGGLRFKSQAGQIGHSVANGSPPLRKSDTVLPTARHRCDISSKEAVLPGRNDAEMGPANSLHASAYYSDYTKRFD